jgi:hypothetical protein
VDFSANNISAFERTIVGDMVLILANVRNTDQAFTLPATISNTNWYHDVEMGTRASISPLLFPLSLSPYQYMLLKKTIGYKIRSRYVFLKAAQYWQI